MLQKPQCLSNFYIFSLESAPDIFSETRKSHLHVTAVEWSICLCCGNFLFKLMVTHSRAEIYTFITITLCISNSIASQFGLYRHPFGNYNFIMQTTFSYWGITSNRYIDKLPYVMIKTDFDFKSDIELSKKKFHLWLPYRYVQIFRLLCHRQNQSLLVEKKVQDHMNSFEVVLIRSLRAAYQHIFTPPHIFLTPNPCTPCLLHMPPPTSKRPPPRPNRGVFS